MSEQYDLKTNIKIGEEIFESLLKGLMIKVIATLLLVTAGTISWAQSDRAESLLSQLMDEIKLETKNYRQVVVDKTIPWDTSEYVFKTYLSRFDTTDMTDISNKSTPARRRIVSFSQLVTDEDYQTFREQVNNQRSATPVKLKGNRKAKDKLTVSFSQPLITVNGKIAIIKEIRNVPGAHYSSTIVYSWNEGRWTRLRYLENEASFGCPP